MGARTARRRGYPIISVADHISSPHPHPHVWVDGKRRFALATERTRVMIAFGNNLVRSPVEFAQAALALHRVSGGRCEAGLGAGWAENEITGMGWEFPSARDRVGRYIEALQIIRSLLHTGACSFHGEYYDIEIPAIGPLPKPPPLLMASLGGDRARCARPRRTSDRLELMGFPVSDVGDAVEFAGRVASFGEDDLRARGPRWRGRSAPEMPAGLPRARGGRAPTRSCGRRGKRWGTASSGDSSASRSGSRRTCCGWASWASTASSSRPRRRTR